MYSLLVVEDEVLLRKGITSLIDFSKFDITRVEEAEDGRIGYEKFIANPFDIVITDINMPNEDGISMVKKIKTLKKDTEIIFLTGYDYFDYALSAIKMGASDYVLKPISKTDIEGVLFKVINNIKENAKSKKIESLIADKGNDIEDEVMKFINDNISNSSLSLNMVASQFGFSPNYFSTLLKKRGVSFQDYVVKQRLVKSKILLLSTNMRIFEIAEAVGFEDVNYFSSRFKQLTGMTPKQFKREAANNEIK